MSSCAHSTQTDLCFALPHQRNQLLFANPERRPLDRCARTYTYLAKTKAKEVTPEDWDWECECSVTDLSTQLVK
eukprot:scaffold14592_cov82-Skeletonema_marinoi.AAC.2